MGSWRRSAVLDINGDESDNTDTGWSDAEPLVEAASYSAGRKKRLNKV